MKRILVLLAAVVLVTSGQSIAGQSKSGSIQGVWQTVELNITGPTPRTITIPQPAPLFSIFTAKHYSRTEIQGETPRPLLPDAAKATADELRAVWGPVVAEAGTYEVSGTTLTVHPLASKSPAAMASGAFIVYSYKIDGNTLTITQVRNQSGPFPNPFSAKLVRVE
jgi:hypothetical protein